MEREELEKRLEEITEYKDIIKLYRDAAFSLKKGKITDQNYNYIEQQLKEKFFNDERFNEYNANVLLKQVCPYIKDIGEFKIEKLNLVNIGETIEEARSLKDIVCMYENTLLNVFGIDVSNFSKSKKYEFKKYMKPSYFEAVKLKCDKKENMKIKQYGQYFVLEENNRMRVFKEKQITALVSIKENAFDKVKARLVDFFNRNVFNKNKYLPNLVEVYNTNKLKDFKVENTNSKSEAKSRMKNVLSGDRERVRVEE